MGLSDPKHPLWPIIRMAVLGVVAVAVLHITASHFDSGELKAAGAVTFASVCFDLFKRTVAQG